MALSLKQWLRTIRFRFKSLSRTHVERGYEIKQKKREKLDTPTKSSQRNKKYWFV